MSTRIGSFLRDVRMSRRRPIEQTARQAGITRTTLSLWESGAHLPRMPELMAVLQTLEVSDAERRHALSLVEAPRAVVRLRHDLRDLPEGTPPGAHCLLKALRVRRGWTQAEAAARVGVRQSTIARWESGENHPDPAQLRALGVGLGAREEEMAALASRLLTARSRHARTLDDLEDAYNAAPLDPLYDPLVDLKAIAWQAEVWPHLAGDRPASARRLLVRVLAHYAQCLSLSARHKEAVAAGSRALDMAPHCRAPEPEHLRAAIWTSLSLARSGGHGAVPSALALLGTWLAALGDVGEDTEPHYAAWLCQTMAEVLAFAGQGCRALEWLGRCRATTNHFGTSSAVGDRDEARIVALAGRPQAAIPMLQSVLDEVTHDHPDRRSRPAAHLYLADALAAVGSRAQAGTHLDLARREAEVYDVPYLLPGVNALAVQLAG